MAIRTFGPLVSTNVCGMTSLFVSTSNDPWRSLTVCVALKVPPPNDHVWQPWTWWRISNDACPPVAAAAALAAIGRRRG